MAENSKMISISKLDEILDERFNNEEVVDYYGNDLVITKTISFAVFNEIVQQVSNICFDPDTGEYTPQKLDFAVRLCVIEAHTNVRLPDDTEHQYRILYGTDLFRTVYEYINHDQYAVMLDAITDAVHERNNANKAMFERDMNTVLEQVNQIGSRLQDMFENIGPDDIQNLVRAIGDNGIDEEKIVKAVVAEQNRQRGEVIQFRPVEAQEDEQEEDDPDGK